MNIKLRIIYSLHMLAPIALVARHIEQLDESTALALRSLFS
jgi:hypothetical protein